MAINLQVTLTLEDKLSSQINKANQSIQNTQNKVKTLDDKLSSTRKSLEKTRSSMSNFGSSGANAVSSINGKFVGLLATIGATHLAMSGLTSIIKKSAEYERSQVTIGAIFDDAEASKAYTDMVKKVAVNSPILDSTAMFSNSLPFLTLSKDSDQLEAAWKVAEKLAIINPLQGVEGSVIAMKELASGDVVSLSERFNIGKKELNGLKELSFKEQVAGLNALISGMGITDKAVVEMGNTTAAQFVKVKEKWDLMLIDMGESSNSKLGDALRSLNEVLDEGKFDAIATALDETLGLLASKIANFVATADWDAISQNVISAFDSINNAIKWAVEHWEEIKTAVKWATLAFIAFKAVTVIISVMTTIITVVTFMSKVFKIARAAFVLLRLSILAFPGSWIVAAIMLVVGVFVLLWQKCEWFRDFWKSAWDSAVESTEWAVNKIISSVNWLIEKLNKIPFVNIDLLGGVDFTGDGKQKGASETTRNANKKQVNTDTSKYTSLDQVKTPQLNRLPMPNSHSGGLSRVPYDGYSATLHKGERVLTKTEANKVEGGSMGNSSISISFAGANFNVRSENDIEEIASVLASKINQSITKGA